MYDETQRSLRRQTLTAINNCLREHGLEPVGNITELIREVLHDESLPQTLRDHLKNVAFYFGSFLQEHET